METGEKISPDGPPVFTRDPASIANDFPSTLLVGPTLVESEEIPDVELLFRVNGETRQRARANDIMYDARDLRRFVGPLSEGDIVLGTSSAIVEEEVD